MGMFDYVDVHEEVTCVKCGTKLHGFQSKSHGCRLDHLDYRDCYYFYSFCDGCGDSFAFRREEFRNGRRVPAAQGLSDFTLIHKASELGGDE